MIQESSTTRAKLALKPHPYKSQGAPPAKTGLGHSYGTIFRALVTQFACAELSQVRAREVEKRLRPASRRLLKFISTVHESVPLSALFVHDEDVYFIVWHFFVPNAFSDKSVVAGIQFVSIRVKDRKALEALTAALLPFDKHFSHSVSIYFHQIANMPIVE